MPASTTRQPAGVPLASDGEPPRSTFLLRERSSLASLAVPVFIGAIIGAALVAIPGASSKTALTSDLTSARATAGSLRSSMDELEAENASLSAQNADLRAQVSSLQEQLDEERARRPLPNFVGRSRDAVITTADDYGWEVVVEQSESGKPVGTVLSIDPPPAR